MLPTNILTNVEQYQNGDEKQDQIRQTIFLLFSDTIIIRSFKLKIQVFEIK